MMRRIVRRKTEVDEWSIGDIWLGLLLLVTGSLLTFVAFLAVRNGHAWVLLIVGIGAFFIGPFMILSGGIAVVGSLWSVRPRSYREVIEDERSAGRSMPPTRIAPDSSRFGVDLERSDR
jgi:hypothetical protein